MHRNRSHIRLETLLLGIWLVAACTAPEDKRPDNLIPEDQMADILTEVHMTEARVSRLTMTSQDSSNVVYKRLESQIFKKFKVDTAVYRASYIFYAAHPSDMEVIYKQVTKNLQQRIDTKQQKKKS